MFSYVFRPLLDRKIKGVYYCGRFAALQGRTRKRTTAAFFLIDKMGFEKVPKKSSHIFVET